MPFGAVGAGMPPSPGGVAGTGGYGNQFGHSPYGAQQPSPWSFLQPQPPQNGGTQPPPNFVPVPRWTDNHIYGGGSGGTATSIDPVDPQWSTLFGSPNPGAGQRMAPNPQTFNMAPPQQAAANPVGAVGGQGAGMPAAIRRPNPFGFSMPPSATLPSQGLNQGALTGLNPTFSNPQQQQQFAQAQGAVNSLPMFQSGQPFNFNGFNLMNQFGGGAPAWQSQLGGINNAATPALRNPGSPGYVAPVAPPAAAPAAPTQVYTPYYEPRDGGGGGN